MNKLPNEIIYYHILSFLGYKELTIIKIVSKRYNELSTNYILNNRFTFDYLKGVPEYIIHILQFVCKIDYMGIS